ncbi:putative AP2 domain protein [Erwinia phage vB_EamM_Kwan]|uniref:Putative AP2 domain protein n=1 Tax=Erwinia phage vB_EamM_Kwan TaxID=1883374 RepID=A0A1B2IE99_9CAUD|nr:restriction endonuclease [Erwinia phage vB_EamM_Kwan]ANZ49606.1 putative AP2 domain protein [Erwinia phage vB_EamM_Kwan]
MARDLRTYSSYRQMLNRCLNTNNHNYYLYGGRGIKICDRWLESYSNFLEDMGIRPEGMTLDRKDNDGDYCLDNCKWSTHVEQCYNRASSHWLIFHYDNHHQYTDAELINYSALPELNGLIEELQATYPLSRIKGGVKFISNLSGVATFVLLKELSDKDLPIGTKVNQLTLVKPIEVGVKNLIVYEWRCDCGNTVTGKCHHVVNGDRKSCGCHRQTRL